MRAGIVCRPFLGSFLRAGVLTPGGPPHFVGPLPFREPKPPGVSTPARHGPGSQRLLAPTPLPEKPPGSQGPSQHQHPFPPSLRQSHLRCCPLPEVPVRPLGLCRTLTGRVTMICVEAPQARITRLACYGARLRGARQRLSSPRPLPCPPSGWILTGRAGVKIRGPG